MITVQKCLKSLLLLLLLHTKVIILSWISVRSNGAATGAAELRMRLLN